MAYPEPIPVITGKHAKEFLRRLESFTLTEKQQELFRGALTEYRKREC